MAWLARVLLAARGRVARHRLVAGRAGPPSRARRPPRASWARRDPTVAGAPSRARDAAARPRGCWSPCPRRSLVASRAVQTWFLAPAHLARRARCVAGLRRVLRLLVARPRRRGRWSPPSAGARAARIVLLLALLVHRPGGYWFAFWTEPARRTAYIAIAFDAVRAGCSSPPAWALAAQVGRPPRHGRRARRRRRRARGRRCVVAAIGLEAALTAWNDQMALLPWGLSRILGITVYLDIPADTGVGTSGRGWERCSRSRASPSPCLKGGVEELLRGPHLLAMHGQREDHEDVERDHEWRPQGSTGIRKSCPMALSEARMIATTRAHVAPVKSARRRGSARAEDQMPPSPALHVEEEELLPRR